MSYPITLDSANFIGMSRYGNILSQDSKSLVTIDSSGLVLKIVLGHNRSGLKFNLSPEEMVDREIKALELLSDVDSVKKFVRRDSSTSFTSHYMPGNTLRRHGAPLTNEYFDELSGLVDECMARGVYRVDTTPSNIIVTPQLRPAIVDFGDAMLKDDKAARIPGILHLESLYGHRVVESLRKKYAAK